MQETQQCSRLYNQAFAAVVDSQNVQEAILAIQAIYGFAHVTYHLARTIGMPVDAPFVRTTYSGDWVSHYLLNNLAASDVIVREGFSREQPFDWDEFSGTAGFQKIMAEAAKFGLGPAGYSVPLIDRSGRRALFSVNGRQDADEWREFLDTIRADLSGLAYDVHQKAITEAYRGVDGPPALAPREVECLSWTAKGKTYTEIATILELSEHTVRTYLKTARFKLDCVTLAQAVAKAAELRLI